MADKPILRYIFYISCAIMMAATTASTGLAQSTHRHYGDCTCRYKGQDMPVGTVICAELPQGEMLLECGRMLNNTAWKTLQQGCPITKLQPIGRTAI